MLKCLSSVGRQALRGARQFAAQPAVSPSETLIPGPAPWRNSAAVLHGVNDMRFEEFPLPERVPSGNVRIEMKAVGICGSDVHYWRKVCCPVAACDLSKQQCDRFHPVTRCRSFTTCSVKETLACENAERLLRLWTILHLAVCHNVVLDRVLQYCEHNRLSVYICRASRLGMDW